MVVDDSISVCGRVIGSRFRCCWGEKKFQKKRRFRKEGCNSWCNEESCRFLCGVNGYGGMVKVGGMRLLMVGVWWVIWRMKKKVHDHVGKKGKKGGTDKKCTKFAAGTTFFAPKFAMSSNIQNSLSIWLPL